MVKIMNFFNYNDLIVDHRFKNKWIFAQFQQTQQQQQQSDIIRRNASKQENESNKINLKNTNLIEIIIKFDMAKEDQ